MILTPINDADHFITIEGNLENLSVSQRTKAALKQFLLFLAIAFGAIFIPVAHFVLVPVFLILSVFFALKEFNIKQNLIIKGTYLCFNCKNTLIIPKKLNNNRRVNCKTCYQQYKLSL